MQLLVTCGAGVIGSTFVRRVLRGEEPTPAGAEVVVLDALTYAGNRENLTPVAADPVLRFVTGDIADGPLVAELMAGVTNLLDEYAEHRDWWVPLKAGAAAIAR
jgi:dTDP-glucose 4,6-dehydratase